MLPNVLGSSASKKMQQILAHKQIIILILAPGPTSDFCKKILKTKRLKKNNGLTNNVRGFQLH